eukprot:m.1539791 g.1539791  ORF g.1539791 m.1539791 type:complete len:59 (-) comp25246_c0_seq26:6470-6646(-)
MSLLVYFGVDTCGDKKECSIPCHSARSTVFVPPTWLPKIRRVLLSNGNMATLLLLLWM